VLVWFFHSPIADKLTQDEINHYLNAIQEFPSFLRKKLKFWIVFAHGP